VSSTGGTSGTGASPGLEPIPLPFVDDFEDRSTAGWLEYIKDEAATWVVQADATSQVVSQTQMGGDLMFLVGGDVSWTDQSLRIRARFDDERTRLYVCARFSRSETYYYLELRSAPPRLYVLNEGRRDELAEAEERFEPVVGTWYTVVLTAQGTTLTASIDGVVVCTATDSSIPNGGVAFGTREGSGSFDDVSVTAP
jgi:hypothetical protein